MNTILKPSVVSALVLALSLSACADMNYRQQRALSGGAIGAAGGAAIAAMTGGGVVTGALIGAGGGAAIGALLPEGRSSSTKK